MLGYFVQKMKMSNALEFNSSRSLFPLLRVPCEIHGSENAACTFKVLTRNALAVAYGFKPTTQHEGVRIVPCSTPTNKPSLSGYRFAVQANK